MHLKKLIIENYKSFFRPTELRFEPGFNVLLGANSSGKSSVLEALMVHQPQNRPHKSLASHPSLENSQVNTGNSICQVDFEYCVDEVKALLPKDKPIWMPVAKPLMHVDQAHSQNTVEILEKFNNSLHTIAVKHEFNYGSYQIRYSMGDWETRWVLVSRNENQICGYFNVTAQEIQNFSGASANEFLMSFQNHCLPKLYKFATERTVKSRSAHASWELQSDASNLAFCINHLQTTNPDLHDLLNTYLHRIFPTIRRVSAPPVDNVFELRVSSVESRLNRGDLAVPVDQVGTGVVNAIAMLYVALTAQTTRIIGLEEPNSYLHPRALRELLAIMADVGGHHQYFVTTHSSDVLRTINSSTITLLEHDGIQTSIKQTTGSKLHELKSGLIDLGIRLTDLHGCDEVLWVEGETEEAVFPLLLRHYFPAKAQGIAVLPVVSTGEFDSKKFGPKKIADIYKRLSESSFLAPPMIAIALDKERRSDQEMKQVKRECGRLVNFLPRTMLEDYFLDAEALTFVINQYAEQAITFEEAQASLKKAMANAKNALNPKNLQNADVHAAKVLNSVFQELLKSEYKKVSHGLDIAAWLLSNKPDLFDELRDWFAKFLK